MPTQGSTRLDHSNIRRTFYVLFAFSGFSGLIYESIWTHYLKLFLGCAAYAQTLVLVIFMGGMALGAWGVGRISAKIHNLLHMYALVEGLIGILALIFHAEFVSVTDFSYFTIIPKLSSPALLALYKWGLAALLILPQTILLGATYPLMSAGLIRLIRETPGRTLALLYFANSIGAVAGVLVSGYVLIGLFGLPGTILSAGLINLVIGLIVWWICRNKEWSMVQIFEQKQLQTTVPSQKIFAAFLLCSCLTGTASFMYEIGWIRMLCLVLGSSTHAFELMLSAFILGLALGGYWIKKSIDGLSNPIKTLGIVQVVMGGFALSTLLFYGQTFNVMGYILAALARTPQGYFFFNLFSQGLSMLVMLPATICAGMTLPIITYYLISKGYGEGSIGKTYAANTTGAILGVLLGVQLIMPMLGVKNIIVVGAAIDILLGLVLLRHAGFQFNRKRWIVVAVLFFGFFLSIAFWVKLDTSKMASGVYRTGISKTNGKVLYHKDGKTASVDLVLYSSSKELSIETNGKPDARIGIKGNVCRDEPTQVLLGALAWGMNDRAKTAAVIGMGSGMTGHVMLTVPSLESVDVIEIEPAIVEGARGFGERVSNTFNDPRSRIAIEDAKTYFTNHHKKYDLIVSEPSNPWVSGVSGLFSKEFYRLIRNYLNEDGLLVQWLQLYEISTPLVASVMKSLSENFEDYEVYFTRNTNLIIFAGEDVHSRKPSEKMFEIPGLKAELARILINNVQDFRLRRLGNKKMLDPLFQSYGVLSNSDFYPFLDLNAVRDRFMANNAFEIIKIRSAAAPLAEVLGEESAPIPLLSVSQTDYFDAGRDAGQAVAIYQYFDNLKRNQKLNTVLLDKSTVQILHNIRLMHGRCQSSELTDEWFPSLHLLSWLTIPYLSPTQMEVIWDDIESSLCYAGMPDYLKSWVQLYKAVSYRNFKKALEYSIKFIPPGEIKASSKNNYLLMVAMLSNIALQNNYGALYLFNRYENKVDPPIEIRLLKAYASQKRHDMIWK
jgi:spermidine synthase